MCSIDCQCEPQIGSPCYKKRQEERGSGAHSLGPNLEHICWVLLCFHHKKGPARALGCTNHMSSLLGTLLPFFVAHYPLVHSLGIRGSASWIASGAAHAPSLHRAAGSVQRSQGTGCDAVCVCLIVHALCKHHRYQTCLESTRHEAQLPPFRRRSRSVVCDHTGEPLRMVFLVDLSSA